VLKHADWPDFPLWREPDAAASLCVWRRIAAGCGRTGGVCRRADRLAALLLLPAGTGGRAGRARLDAGPAAPALLRAPSVGGGVKGPLGSRSLHLMCRFSQVWRLLAADGCRGHCCGVGRHEAPPRGALGPQHRMPGEKAFLSLLFTDFYFFLLQDIVKYLRTRSDVAGAVLQAPVSDREYLATVATTAASVKLAEELARTDPQAVLPLHVRRKRKKK
jgi:hypothetical protein